VEQGLWLPEGCSGQRHLQIGTPTMRPLSSHLCFAVAIAVTLSGCSVTQIPEGPSPGVRVPDSASGHPVIRYDTAVVIDKRLQSWEDREHKLGLLGKVLKPSVEARKFSRISVEKTECTRTETGTLQVRAMLRNRTDSTIQVEGRALFFNSQKSLVEGPSPWRRVFLPPQSLGQYHEFSAADSGIEHYYIELREGR
jgi:hypothetical protein